MEIEASYGRLPHIPSTKRIGAGPHIGDLLNSPITSRDMNPMGLHNKYSTNHKRYNSTLRPHHGDS